MILLTCTRIIKWVSRLFLYGHFYWEYTHETLVPFEAISFSCNAHLVPFKQLLEGPMEVLLCERVNDLRHSLFHLLICLITTDSELRELAKVTGSKVWTVGRLRNCLDAHPGQIVCDKDGVVDSCIVLVEMPLSRFWRMLTSSLGISSWTPLKPQHNNHNPNPLAKQLWSIDFLSPPTPLIIPHRLPAFLESLMPLKNRCSIHARCTKSSLKHSIRFYGIIFSKFKT